MVSFLARSTDKILFLKCFTKMAFYILIYSTIICIPINPYPPYCCTCHPSTNQSPSNFFEKIMRKEKDVEIYFCYVFYNAKKNPSEIFSNEKERNILFFYFQIYSKCNGYLFNIITIMSNVITTHNKRVDIIALIVLNKKNKFEGLRQMDILVQFFTKKLEYLIMFNMILFLCICIKQFLLVYQYVYIYQLYLDIVLFYYLHKLTSNKKITKIYNNTKKILKILKQGNLVLLRCVAQAKI